MEIDSTFWVAVSFFIFFGVLVYLKVPQKINEILNKLILDIKNEIDESEKLRTEAKMLLDNAQKKLNTAQSVGNEILEQAKKDGDKLIIELNDKFHKSSEIKKNSNVDKILKKTIKSKKAEFINVFIKPDQKIIPKLAFGSPLEDLSPPLPRKEFLNNIFNNTKKI